MTSHPDGAGEPGSSETSAGLIRAAPVVECRPWPRHVLPAESWAALAPDDVVFEALWADTAVVYALFVGADGQPLFASIPAAEGRYSALSPQFPAAAAAERMVRDLWGHDAVGAVDGRPWLDHGAWGFSRPLASRHGPPGPSETMLNQVADGLMQIPVGPVTGGLEEAAHLRVATDGRVIRQSEARLGYGHKGTLALVRGKPARAAARFAARLSADATVAHGIAFARAVEAALGVVAPARAAVLRGVMAELERIATHLGDLARACPGVTRLAWHREQVLRVAALAFGHRMMMDCVVPGGVAQDVAAGGPGTILTCLDAIAADLPGIARRLAEVGAGVARVPEAVRLAFAPGGVVGRSAGLGADARVRPGYSPYGGYDPPVTSGGDVAARLQLRVAEIDRSMVLLDEWLADLPPGAFGVSLPPGNGEGLAVAESARGAVWHWVRLDGGTIGSAFFADPSWRLWPVQETASLGAPVADLALIDASFACARSGVDL